MTVDDTVQQKFGYATRKAFDEFDSSTSLPRKAGALLMVTNLMYEVVRRKGFSGRVELMVPSGSGMQHITVTNKEEVLEFLDRVGNIIPRLLDLIDRGNTRAEFQLVSLRYVLHVLADQLGLVNLSEPLILE